MERPMLLSQGGWYPPDSLSCKKEIVKYIDNSIFIEGKTPISCVVPHAGWYFCGRLLVNTIRLMKEKNGTIKRVFIFGGHLAENNLPVVETFDGAATPFGTLYNNRQVLHDLTEMNIQTINFRQDNTIEVILPVIQYFFGNVEITAIYMPPGKRSKEITTLLYEKYNKSSIFIGSADLTHYGPRFGFFHRDKSMSAVDWVKNVNDKGYIDLVLSMAVDKALSYAVKNNSTCSAGAVAAAMTVAKLDSVESGMLIGYGSSYDMAKDDSFVSYAGILF